MTPDDWLVSAHNRVRLITEMTIMVSCTCLCVCMCLGFGAMLMDVRPFRHPRRG